MINSIFFLILLNIVAVNFEVNQSGKILTPILVTIFNFELAFFLNITERCMLLFFIIFNSVYVRFLYLFSWFFVDNVIREIFYFWSL